MTQSSSAEFAQETNNSQTTTITTTPTTTAAATQWCQERTKATETTKSTPKYSEILLNNFQIKKKSYRVLLNGEHVVWERMHAKPTKAETTAKKQQQQAKAKAKEAERHEHEQLSVTPAATTATASVTETQYKTCQIGGTTTTTAAAATITMPTHESTAPAYGSKSHVLHINEIICVRKGDSKHAAQRAPVINNDAESTSSSTPSPSPAALSVKPTAQYLCIHFAERILKSPTDCNRWHVRHLTLYNADPYIVRQWHDALNALLAQSLRVHVRRLLVFINPYGGRKQGLQTYERHCKPIFQLAGVDASCIISQRANQIRDILMSHDLSVFDAVCCVGGDGTAAEVINGLLFRTMRELGLDERRPAYIPKPMLPVGVIPAGSTDTIAYSMHGTSDVRTAAIHLILGQRRGLDVCSVRNRDCLLRFCASVLSYGYLGDVAAKSEAYRWMGTKRYEYTGVKAFIGNRGYDAELRLLVEDDAQTPCTPLPPPTLTQESAHLSSSVDGISSTLAASVCYAKCQRCSTAASLQESLGPEQMQALYNTASDDGADDCSIGGNVFDNAFAEPNNTPFAISPLATPTVESLSPAALQTQLSNNEAALLRRRSQDIRARLERTTLSLTSSISSQGQSSQARWQTIKGKFFMICGANITCACSRSPNGISRYSHLGDGFLDLILVRKTSLLNNVRFLLNTAGRDGDIRNLPFVEVYRTRKFHFRTLTHSVDGDSTADAAANAAAVATDEAISIRGSCQPIANAYAGAERDDVSSWNCDGEVVTDLEITMSSHCQLIDVFMRGPYSYTKPTKAVTEIPENVSSNSVFCCCRD